LNDLLPFDHTAHCFSATPAVSSPLKPGLSHVSIFSCFNWYAPCLNALLKACSSACKYGIMDANY